MSVAVANPVLLTDGDAAFLRVDNRRPAHALPPGVAASATNKMFEDGQARPRYGVALDPWGQPGANLITNTSPTFISAIPYAWVTITGLTVGRRYLFLPGNAYGIAASYTTNGVGDRVPPADVQTTRGYFLATATSYYLWITVDGYAQPLTARIYPGVTTLAYARFNDPVSNTDNAILITDDWRDGPGEDGGRGRAWRIQSGNAPQQISLNGHDVWRQCFLEQAHNAMILARADGNERHYFTADDVNAVLDRIKIHCAPSWGQGAGNAKRVRYELASAGANIPSGPMAGNYYYAKYTLSGSDHFIELYTDSGCTNKLTIDPGSLGRFYVELATDPIPWWGNGAPPLILQANATNDALDLGFVAVTSNVAITSTNNSTGLISAANHRLLPGDAATVTDITGLTTGYVAPRSEHTFVLYASPAEALADSGTVLLPTSNGDTGSVKKTSASSIPIPPLRRVRYLNGRLWGIVAKDTIVQSDPFDFLHYTLYVSTVAANQGEAGQANWLCPLGEDVMLIGKDQKVIALSGISGAVSGWREGTITEEFGGIAPLAALNVGSDVWLFSRKGVASIVRTVAGQRLAIVRTVSHDIPAYLREIDFANARGACAAIWNNRFLLAVPNKGQDLTSGTQQLDAEALPSTPSASQNLMMGAGPEFLMGAGGENFLG